MAKYRIAKGVEDREARTQKPSLWMVRALPTRTITSLRCRYIGRSRASRAYHRPLQFERAAEAFSFEEKVPRNEADEVSCTCLPYVGADDLGSPQEGQPLSRLSPTAPLAQGSHEVRGPKSPPCVREGGFCAAKDGRVVGKQYWQVGADDPGSPQEGQPLSHASVTAMVSHGRSASPIHFASLPLHR